MPSCIRAVLIISYPSIKFSMADFATFAYSLPFMPVSTREIIPEKLTNNIWRSNEALLDHLKLLTCLEKTLSIIYDVFTASIIP